MATKKKGKPAKGGASSQHADSKGVNDDRSTKPVGVGAVGVIKGGGSSSFRKNRKGGD